MNGMYELTCPVCKNYKFTYMLCKWCPDCLMCQVYYQCPICGTEFTFDGCGVLQIQKHGKVPTKFVILAKLIKLKIKMLKFKLFKLFKLH